jgi:tetratricopeptide (TPR) repeat protein
MTVRSLLPITLLLSIAAAAPGADADPPRRGPKAADLRRHAEELAQQLDDEAFKRREEAMLDLARLGGAAVPALEKAAQSERAEVRWRAETALRMIRWNVTERFRAKAGDALADYEKRVWHERERLAVDLSAIGGREALPALSAMLARDKSLAVKRAAAIGLLRMGPEGLLAIEKNGKGLIELPADSAVLRVQIGNGFLEEGKYERAVAEYKRAIAVDPKHDVAWYNLACAYARLKKTDEAVDALKKAFEVGYDDVGWMKKDPDLENLREAPAYRELLERLERHGPPRPPRPPDEGE